jgi:hypothetical protein
MNTVNIQPNLAVNIGANSNTTGSISIGSSNLSGNFVLDSGAVIDVGTSNTTGLNVVSGGDITMTNSSNIANNMTISTGNLLKLNANGGSEIRIDVTTIEVGGVNGTTGSIIIGSNL